MQTVRASTVIDYRAERDERELATTRIRVLFVEDDADCRSLVERLFRRSGFDCRAAASVSSAMEILQGFWPDVIVSDLSMPGEDGFSFIRRVQDLKMGRFIPAIALTAFGSEHVRRRTLVTGFDLHMTKPVDPEKLVQAVRDLVVPVAR